MLAEVRRWAEVDLAAAIHSRRPVRGAYVAVLGMASGVERAEVPDLRVVLEVFHAELGRERHVLALQTLHPIGARARGEHFLQLECDALVVARAVGALRILLRPLRTLYDAAQRL